MSFQALAFVLQPAEPGLTATIDEADDRWSLAVPPDPETAVVIWGRGPLLSGTRPVVAARAALARERALRSIRKRSPTSFRVVAVHRLPPPVLAGGRVRNRVRAALLEGAIVELWSQPQVLRVIDAVAEEAQGSARVTRLMSGSGGSALVRLPRKVGGEAMLRAARAGDPADPHRGAEALETLAPLGWRHIPRLLGQGQVAGASWATETVLPGHRPPGVSAAVTRELALLFAALPRSDQAAAAHTQDLGQLTVRFPRWATVLSQIAEEVGDVARAVPSLVRHGDLWAGNILVRRQRLTGIIDWDAWHPAALPGADLLHLVATSEAMRKKQGFSQTWLRQPWEGEDYRSAMSDYWKITRIVPNARFLRAVGMAWWAGHVAASIRRLPRLAEEDHWVASNVERVLEAVGGRT
ncbi:MAG TPA: phosphotransferase [Actinomycetota bacterium]